MKNGVRQFQQFSEFRGHSQKNSKTLLIFFLQHSNHQCPKHCSQVISEQKSPSPQLHNSPCFLTFFYPMRSQSRFFPPINLGGSKTVKYPGIRAFMSLLIKGFTLVFYEEHVIFQYLLRWFLIWMENYMMCIASTCIQ